MFEEQITRGMALLDEKEPGWDKRVSLDHEPLNMSSLYRCVLGQVFGYFDNTEARMFLDRGPGNTHWERARHFRFAAKTDELSYSEAEGIYTTLTDEWRAALRARREGGNPHASDASQL